MDQRMNRGKGLAALLMLTGLVVTGTTAADEKSTATITVSYNVTKKNLFVNATKDPYPQSGTLNILEDANGDPKDVKLVIDKSPVTVSDCKAEGDTTVCKYEFPSAIKEGKYTLTATGKVGGGEVAGERPEFVYSGKAAAPESPKDKPPKDPPQPPLFQATSLECNADEPLLSCAYKQAIDYVDGRMGYTADCEAKCTCWKGDCQKTCLNKCNWAKTLKNKLPQNIYEEHIYDQDIAIVFFDDLGAPLYSLPQIDEDDRLFVVIVPVHGRTIGDVRVNACAARAAINIGGSFKLPDDRSVETKGNDSPKETPKVKLFIAEAADGCSSDGGFKGIFTATTTTSTDGKETKTADAKEIAVPTLTLNRITLGVGLVYDFSLETQYRASSVAGQNVPVVVEDKHVRGLTPPVAFVSLRPFAVDLKRTRKWYQSVSPTLGVSLTNPLDHLLLGLLIDPIPGIGFTAGYHLRREPVLGGGYQIGDRISGTEVPTDMRWAKPERRDVFLGLNLDAGVLARIVGGFVK